jgi:hypothetical protein
MSPAFIANQGLLSRLIPRLDACVANVQRIEPDCLAQQHGVVYAAYLTEFAAGLIPVDDPSTVCMLGMVVEFCDLVEREYPTPTLSRMSTVN